MITIYAIRGTNGSGKSTLARSFIADKPSPVDLTWYDSPTKRDPKRRKSVTGYASPHLLPGVDVLVVGSYQTACGGLDTVPNFDTTFKALDGAVNLCREYGRAENQAIVCEGVLSSTVWGSWGEYAQAAIDADGCDVNFAFCYLDTPLEVCLNRIRGRQEAAGKVRDIKNELVADKIKAIAATRRKAIEAGHLVYDLPYETAHEALRYIMLDEVIERYNNNKGDNLKSLAREFYRART